LIKKQFYGWNNFTTFARFVQRFSGIHHDIRKPPWKNKSSIKFTHHNIANTNFVVDDGVLEKTGTLQNSTGVFAIPVTNRRKHLGKIDNSTIEVVLFLSTLYANFISDMSLFSISP